MEELTNKEKELLKILIERELLKPTLTEAYFKYSFLDIIDKLELNKEVKK